MHGFHVVPPSAPLNPAPVRACHPEAGCCINTASAHSMVRLSGSGMICRLALTVGDVDVEMRKYSPEQNVDGFPLLLVARVDAAWHTV